MKTNRAVNYLLTLSIILLLEATLIRADEEGTCIALGDSCQTDYYAEDCCEEESGISCIEPYLGIGFTKCSTCRAEG